MIAINAHPEYERVDAAEEVSGKRVTDSLPGWGRWQVGNQIKVCLSARHFLETLRHSSLDHNRHPGIGDVLLPVVDGECGINRPVAQNSSYI